jgi:hypothetical protein
MGYDMKVALICYHKNVETLYDPKWIEEYRYSILNQTYKEFDIFELEYSGGDYRIFENSIYHSKEFPAFVPALNYLLDCIFFMGYDCVANTNADDVYALDRLEKQLPHIESGFDIVSSNFALTRDGQVVHRHEFNKMDLPLELSNNNNLVCHPSVIYNRTFWKNNRYIPEQQPLEDLMLWQRTVNKYKFFIHQDILLYHRLHDNSVCNSDNR